MVLSLCDLHFILAPQAAEKLVKSRNGGILMGTAALALPVGHIRSTDLRVDGDGEE
jgi:hypothetical protein